MDKIAELQKKELTERVESALAELTRVMNQIKTRVDAMSGIGSRLDIIETRLASIGARVDEVGHRIGQQVVRAINAPRHYHTASEYKDMWGSGRRRTGRYG